MNQLDKSLGGWGEALKWTYAEDSDLDLICDKFENANASDSFVVEKSDAASTRDQMAWGARSHIVPGDRSKGIGVSMLNEAEVEAEKDKIAPRDWSSTGVNKQLK